MIRYIHNNSQISDSRFKMKETLTIWHSICKSTRNKQKSTTDGFE